VPGHAPRGPLTIINASERKKPECLGLERPRVTGKATSMRLVSPAKQGWHFATSQGMLAALRASGL
jgi:hypothetical protein